MLKHIPALLLVAWQPLEGQAQTVALFAVNQPPQFQVDAGDDLVYEPGLTLQVMATGGTSNFTYLWSPSQYLNDPTTSTPQVQGLFGTALFTVQVTDPGLGCTLSDQVLVDFSTGIAGLGNGEFSMFPNPTNGLVRILGPAALQFVQVSAPNGTRVMEWSGVAARDLVLDVSCLPAGVYFVTIAFTDGRTRTHKLCATTAN